MKTLVVCILAVLVALQYSYWTGRSGHFAVQELRVQIQAEEEYNSRLHERNDRLRRQVMALRQGAEPVEALARRELGMIKRGEDFYVVVNPGVAP